MSGHFGGDKTVQLLCSKLFFTNIKEKVSQFVTSSEACQFVKAGNKFDKGGEKLKSVPVPYQTINQLCIDLITKLPKTLDGYNTIVTAVDYTIKWVKSRPLKGKFTEGVAEFMCDLVCYFGASKIQISDKGREFVNTVHVIHVHTVNSISFVYDRVHFYLCVQCTTMIFLCMTMNLNIFFIFSFIRSLRSFMSSLALDITSQVPITPGKW